MGLFSKSVDSVCVKVLRVNVSPSGNNYLEYLKFDLMWKGVDSVLVKVS